jgi:hypothetical protein
VFWHTQGSGKSLSMVFYVHRLIQVYHFRSKAKEVAMQPEQLPMTAEDMTFLTNFLYLFRQIVKRRLL